MPRVYHKYKDKIPANSVYIGRPTIWGNPFIIGKDGDRDQVIQKYTDWLLANPELVKRAKQQLQGKDLVCYCAPLRCHGDILLKIANPTLQG